MKKLLDVFKFTYRQAVKSKWFAIMMVSGILLIVGLFNADAISRLFLDKEQTTRVALYDFNNEIPADTFNNTAMGIEYIVVQDEMRAHEIIDKMQENDTSFSAAIYFNEEGAKTNVYLSSEISHEETDQILKEASDFTMAFKAVSLNISVENIADILSPENMNVVHMKGAVDHTMIVIVLIIVLYLIVLLYGTMISNSVVEEKSNRIMETLICAADPKHLLFGKVLGMFAVSMTQLCVWGILAFAMSRFMPGAENVLLILGAISMGKTVGMLIIFTLLGYLMYAMVFGTLGSLADNSQDATQLMLPTTVVLVLVYLAAIMAIEQPNVSYIVALSYLPFSAPVIAFARAVVLDLSWIEIIPSIIIQLVYILGIGLISSKIYKKGVISYGVLSNLFKRQKTVQPVLSFKKIEKHDTY